MNFNLVSSLLAVSSVHDTVHIFKLGQRATSKNNTEASNSNQSLARVTVPRFCFLMVANQQYKEYRRFFRDDIARYGDFL
ncbi:hypothetical protein BYT27DRAFT_7187520 [Phlegmacium glaucopus]|nr:hypothetical protein BYT27DRAFT_7187520 [Phlegmacium glaucopus]